MHASHRILIQAAIRRLTPLLFAVIVRGQPRAIPDYISTSRAERAAQAANAGGGQGR